MTDLNTVLKAQSFPSIDVRIAWALTLACLLMGLLLTLGVLQVQMGPLPGWAWMAVVCAQVLTAFAIAGATRLSQRKQTEAPETDQAASGAH